MKTFNRVLSFLLVACLLLSVVPSQALAVGGREDLKPQTQTQNQNQTQTVGGQDVAVNRLENPLAERMEALAQNAPQQADSDVTYQEIEKPEGLDLTQDQENATLASETIEPTQVVRAIVVLEEKGLMEQGFSTSAIGANGVEIQAQQQSILDRQAQVMGEIQSVATKMDAELEVRYQYTIAVNGMAIEAPYGTLAEIEKLSGVKTVFVAPQYSLPEEVNRDEVVQPYTYKATETVGAHQAWDIGYTGENMRVAVVDTGLDTDHPAFATAPKGDDLMEVADIEAVLDQLNASSLYRNLKAENVYYSEKIPYAFNYIDQTLDATHDNDEQSDHGTHVAGIIAANHHEGSDVVGVAPDAQILVMKVFGANGGAYFDDILASLEDAILLEADAVNMSLGSPAGFASVDPYIDEIFARVLDSDMICAVAAGNSTSAAYLNNDGTNLNKTQDPDNSVMSSPGTYIGSTSVASVENFYTRFNYFALEDGTAVAYNDVAATAFASLYDLAADNDYMAEFFLIPGYGDVADFAGIAPTLNEDGTRKYAVSVAMVSRGVTDFTSKQTNASSAGFDAIVVYNNTDDGFLNMVDAELIPNIFVTKESGEAIIAAADENGYGLIQLKNSDDTVTVETSTAGQMSSFSSWGVGPNLELEPEVTAPGGNIYSTYTNGHYGMMSGTSMATPSIAGQSALILQYLHKNYPDLTDAQYHIIAEALLISTAEPIIEYDEVPYSPRKQGAGLANVAQAIQSAGYITVKDGGEEKTPKISFGDDHSKTGVYHFSFQINNLDGTEQTYVLDGQALTDQVAMDQYGTTYMSETSRPLDATFRFQLSKGNADTRYDYNQDTVVDMDDVQELLDAVNGLATVKDFDLNGDGKTNTADAQALYEVISDYETVEEVTVPAGGTVTVTATLTLTEDDKAYMDAYYENGIYVDGFIRAYAKAEEEVDLVVPFMGFYGDWSAARIFDDVWYYDDDSVIPERYWNVLFTSVGGTQADANLGMNPYIAEEYDPAHNVLSPNGDNVLDSLVEVYMGMLRNAKLVTMEYVDETGKVLDHTEYAFVEKSYYYSAYGIMLPMIYSESGEAFYDFAGVPELSKLTLNIDGYLDDGDDIYDDRESVPVVLDMTAPQIVGEITMNYDPDTDTRTITFTVEDNYDIAAVAMLTEANSGYEFIPVTTKTPGVDGETAELTVDVSGYDASFKIALCDYGCNERFYEVNFAGKENYGEDTFYAYRLLSAIPSGSNIYLTSAYNGWHSFQSADYMLQHAMPAAGEGDVYAAEYIDGYVIAIDDDSQIFAMKMGTWDRLPLGELVCEVDYYGMMMDFRFPALDMAFDYTTETLYVLTDESAEMFAGGGHLMTLNWLTGEVTDLGVLWLGENGDHQPLTLACDNEGVLYTIDAATGDLYTINVTEEGVTGTLVGATGYVPLYQQSMTVDHDTNKLYWAAYQNYTGQTMFFELDKATGKILAETETEYNSQLAGLFKPYDAEDTADLIPDDAVATEITLDDALTMKVGQTASLTCKPQPYYASLDATQISWTSSDETVATVSDGIVTAVGKGEATITATYGEMTATTTANVVDIKGEVTFFDYGTDSYTTNAWYRADINNYASAEGLEYGTAYGFTAATYVDGWIYAFDGNGDFYKLDPDTMAPQLIASTGSSNALVFSLAFNYADGYLYGMTYDASSNFDLYQFNIKTGERRLIIEGLNWMYSNAIGGMAIDYEGMFYFLGLDYSDQTVIHAGKLVEDYGYYYLNNVAYATVPDMYLSSFGSITWSEENDGLLWANEYGELVWIGTEYTVEMMEDMWGSYEQPVLKLQPVSMGQNDALLGASTGLAMVTCLLQIDENAPEAPEVPIETVTVTQSLTVPVSGTQQIHVSAEPWNTDYTVKYNSKNTSIVTVDENGNVYGTGLGQTTVVVEIYNADGSLFGTYNVAIETVDADVDLYAYFISDGMSGGEKWISFNGANPSTATVLANQPEISYAATYYNGLIYAIGQDADRNWKNYMVKLDPKTFQVVERTDYEMACTIYDMAFDYTTGTMYVAVADDTHVGTLAQMNLATGEMTFLADMGTTVGAVTVDDQGVIYVATADMGFCTVDRVTGELTHIGSFDCSCIFESLHYDYNTGNMFYLDGYLYIVDPATGAKTSLGYPSGAYMQANCLYTIPDEEPTVPATTPVTGVCLPERAAMVLGESLTLEATVLPVSVAKVDQTKSWSSSDESIATVDANGNITAHKAGTVTITVNASGYTDECTLNVLAEAQKFYLYNETTRTWIRVDTETGEKIEVRKDKAGEAPITASIYQRETDTIYAYDADGYFYSIDPVTFDRTQLSIGISTERFWVEGPTGDYIEVQPEVSDMAFTENGHLLALLNATVQDSSEGYFMIHSRLYEINLEEGKMDDWGEYEIPVGTGSQIYNFSDAPTMTRPANILVRNGCVYFVDTWMSALLGYCKLNYTEWPGDEWGGQPGHYYDVGGAQYTVHTTVTEWGFYYDSNSLVYDPVYDVTYCLYDLGNVEGSMARRAPVTLSTINMSNGRLNTVVDLGKTDVYNSLIIR